MNEETAIQTLSDLSRDMRSMIESQKADFDARIAELQAKGEALTAEVNELRAAKAHPFDVPGYAKTGDPQKDWSWMRFMRGAVAGEWDRNGPEYELAMESTNRAQSAGVDTQGGFMVPPMVMVDDIIPALEARVISLQAGADLIDDLKVGPVEFPREDSTVNGYWVDEGNTIGKRTLTYGQMKLNPRACAMIVEVTKRLLSQTSQRAEARVRTAIVKGIARTWDLAVFKGTGVDQPLGILNHAGLPSAVSFSGIAATTVVGKLEDMIGVLEDNDADFGKMCWFGHPAGLRRFSKYVDSEGRQILQSTLSAQLEMLRMALKAGPAENTGPSKSLVGYPAYHSTQLVGGTADDDLIFMPADQIVIGMWGGLVLGASDVAGDAFEKHIVKVKGLTEIDVGLAHSAAVAQATLLGT